jgi:nucleotide-binding universal stress UspA family protein
MKILVGIAPGDVREEVLTLSLYHATHFKAKAYLVSSLEGGSSTTEKEVENAQQALAYAKSQFDQKGIVCETFLLIRGNSPDRDLVEFAQEKEVDEIIVGARKRSPVGKAILGSVTQRVALSAACPVVLVK